MPGLFQNNKTKLYCDPSDDEADVKTELQFFSE